MATERKLYRSKTDRVILGVAGGLGEYFEIDPIIVRLIFVLLTIWGGAGILFYIIAAIIIPEVPGAKNKKKDVEEGEIVGEKKNKKETKSGMDEKASAAAQQIKVDMKNNPNRGAQIFGVILLFLGFVFLAQMFFPWFDMGKLWPLILIIFGIFLLTNAGRGKR